MSKSFNEIAYNNAYKKANYYTARVLFPKECEPKIKSAAAAAGQSVSEFIRTAVMEKLNK